MLSEELISFIKTNRSKGRGEAFVWTDDELITYLHWAATFNYLFIESEENRITGAAVVYPIAKKEEQTLADLMTFKANIPVSEEGANDLCLMDIVTFSPEATKRLVIKIKERYPNWSNQVKWGMRLERPFNDGFHKITKISNKYINLLTI